MDFSRWFHDQLQTSGEGFIWGARQVPDARRLILPPESLGEWTAARHVFHIAYYEQTLALPGMRQWLGDPLPSLEGIDEDLAWAEEKHDFEELLESFKRVRAEQVALLTQFDATAWNTACNTVWGPVTLTWVVSKTFQHTADHTNGVLRMALFWERAAAQQRRPGAG